MQNHFQVLNQCLLFQGIPTQELSQLLACLDAKIVSYPKKTFLFSEGDDADFIGILLSGSVTISQLDYFGNRTILGKVVSGELFGESFACAGEPQLPVDVTADEDATVLLVPIVRVLHPCETACSFHHKIIFRLMQIMAQKNLELHRKIQITARRSTREKLLAYLLSESKKQGSRSIRIPFNRQELADYLGVDRSGLSNEISKLRKEQILICKKNYFELLSP